MLTEFWNILFDSGEWINLVSDVKRTDVIHFSWILEDKYNRRTNPDNFICINPLTQFGRKDINVTSLRNILIEIDDMPPLEQVSYITSLGMPHSTCTFSGAKSMHFIISLKEPCKNIKEYKVLVKRIQNKVPRADRSTGNPSRLSRSPGALRDGVEQTLQYIRGRVPNEMLEAWLGPMELKTEEFVKVQSSPGKKRLLPARVLAFIEYGADEGGRNHALFTNACELFRAGYDFEEIEAIAQKVLDLPTFEIRQCINSARRAVERDG